MRTVLRASGLALFSVVVWTVLAAAGSGPYAMQSRGQLVSMGRQPATFTNGRLTDRYDLVLSVAYADDVVPTGDVGVDRVRSFDVQVQQIDFQNGLRQDFVPGYSSFRLAATLRPVAVSASMSVDGTKCILDQSQDPFTLLVARDGASRPEVRRLPSRGMPDRVSPLFSVDPLRGEVHLLSRTPSAAAASSVLLVDGPQKVRLHAAADGHPIKVSDSGELQTVPEAGLEVDPNVGFGERIASVMKDGRLLLAVSEFVSSRPSPFGAQRTSNGAVYIRDVHTGALIQKFTSSDIQEVFSRLAPQGMRLGAVMGLACRDNVIAFSLLATDTAGAVRGFYGLAEIATK